VHDSKGFNPDYALENNSYLFGSKS
jgi:hypothetical protein